LRIYVAASVRGKQLRIVVKNSGEWVEPNPKTSLNTGIINLKKRLGLLYGTNASLHIDRAGDGILAALSLPISPLHS
jgi:LytS/YehU family sensor histidine kinase